MKEHEGTVLLCYKSPQVAQKLNTTEPSLRGGLLKAESQWNEALAGDYTAKASAHQTAVRIRQLYNPDYVDDFDYTFGTNFSAYDDGEYGKFMKTITGYTSDGAAYALSGTQRDGSLVLGEMT